MSKVAILGCTGRMGRALLEALRERTDMQLSGALASASNAALDTVVSGNVAITSDARRALEGADVAVDFTLPAAMPANLAACVERRVPLVIGTTGLDAKALAALREVSRTLAILHSPNMSVGVNVLLGLVEQAARALGREYDVEIVDIHHRHKRDAPSGTALKLGETVAQSRGDAFESVALRGTREGARKEGQIGFAAVRAGDHVGEHTVLFSASGETLSLSHRATDRLTFARGALHAARWLIGRPAGLYQMRDVIASKPSA